MDRRFGPRADDDIVRRQGLDLLQSDLIAASHLNLQRILPEHLHQVVGKGVIVVEDQHRRCHGNPPKKEKPPGASLGGNAYYITHVTAGRKQIYCRFSLLSAFIENMWRCVKPILCNAAIPVKNVNKFLRESLARSLATSI